MLPSHAYSLCIIWIPRALNWYFWARANRLEVTVCVFIMLFSYYIHSWTGDSRTPALRRAEFSRSRGESQMALHDGYPLLSLL